MMLCFFFFFFFQAEDGIRDLTVTGVQTCALPICSLMPASPPRTGRGRSAGRRCGRRRRGSPTGGRTRPAPRRWRGRTSRRRRGDRKSVVEGKSGEIGGRGMIKKKKTKNER